MVAHTHALYTLQIHKKITRCSFGRASIHKINNAIGQEEKCVSKICDWIKDFFCCVGRTFVAIITRTLTSELIVCV